MLTPESVPSFYPSLLFCLRTDQVRGIRIAIQAPLLFELFQQRCQFRPIVKGLVPVCPLCDDIHIHRIIHTDGGIHLTQQIFLLFGHIIDMVHVGVKRSVQTIIAEDKCQDEDHPQQPTMTLWGTR